MTSEIGLAVAILAAGWVSTPPSRAREPRDTAAQYQQKCDRGNAEACFNLGILYGTGDGVAPDKVMAVQLFQKACDGGDAAGCLNLGSAYARGGVVARDNVKAAQLFQKACAGGNRRGCYSLGLGYYEGAGVAQDKVRAAQLFQKACDAGMPEACFGLGTAYYKGNGVTQARAKATAFYQQACGLGLADGCRALKTLAQVRDLGCAPAEKLENTYTPIDLYTAVATCINSGQYEKGTLLFALAGAYGRFDTFRVADKSAHDAAALVRMQVVGDVDLDKGKRDAFQNTFTRAVANPKSLAAMCNEIVRIGPPSYYPSYMVQHGAGAYVAATRKARGMANRESGNGLVGGFDAKTAWRQTLDTYLQCPRP